MPQTGDPFVEGVVGAEVEALQIRAPLAVREGPLEADSDVFAGLPVTENHALAMHAEDFVDDRREARPTYGVERGLVERCKDAAVARFVAHGAASTRRRAADTGPPRPGRSPTGKRIAVPGSPMPGSIGAVRTRVHPQHWGGNVAAGRPNAPRYWGRGPRHSFL